MQPWCLWRNLDRANAFDQRTNSPSGVSRSTMFALLVSLHTANGSMLAFDNESEFSTIAPLVLRKYKSTDGCDPGPQD